jgi:hypothetical protein
MLIVAHPQALLRVQMAQAGLVRKAHYMERLHVLSHVLLATLEQVTLSHVEVMVPGLLRDRALQVGTIVQYECHGNVMCECGWCNYCA